MWLFALVLQLFCSLVPRLTPSVEEFLPSYTAPNSTPMTVIAAENPPSPRETQSDLRPDSPVSPPRQATNAGCFAQPRDDRPALVVSSTSWTADEDFELLLRAATLYERRARELASAAGQTGGLSSALRSQRARESRRPSIGSLRTSEPAKILPKMLLVVTGRGELRANYERQIAKLETEEKWEWVRIRTAWLESEEYPVLLGASLRKRL